MELGIDILAMLFAAAFIAAFIDAIAGGGGLITIPALLMTGMPPAMALGTNKLQAFGGALSASIYFLRKRAVNLPEFSFILYFLFTPKLGESDRKQRISYAVFALCFGSLLGFYDGFFGPGTGSLMNLACVTLLGFNLTKATAHAKVMNLTSNLASLIFFLIGGHVIWTVGLVMMAGSLIGANLGAKMVMAKGKQLIRPMVVIMSFIMTIKMAYDQGWFHF